MHQYDEQQYLTIKTFLQLQKTASFSSNATFESFQHTLLFAKVLVFVEYLALAAGSMSHFSQENIIIKVWESQCISSQADLMLNRTAELISLHIVDDSDLSTYYLKTALHLIFTDNYCLIKFFSIFQQ